MIENRKLRGRLPIAVIFIITLSAFLKIDEVTTAMQAAISLCAKSVVPSLFPFLILTEIIMSVPYGKETLERISKPFSFFFRTSSVGGAVYLIGILFGFPLAVKVLCTYRRLGAVTKKEAERILLFSNNTGPAFLIGGIGGRMLGSLKLGLLLYLTQIAVSFLFGVFLGLSHKKEKEAPLPTSQADAFSLPLIIQKCSLQMLSVCGCIAFFSVIASLLSSLIPSNVLKMLLYSLTEIGGAAAFISSFGYGALTLSFLSFAISFSGASVYLQSLDFLSKTDISSKYYIPVKLLQGFCAFFISYLLLPIFA